MLPIADSNELVFQHRTPRGPAAGARDAGRRSASTASIRSATCDSISKTAAGSASPASTTSRRSRWFDGEFRRTLEATGLGYQHEIDMLKLARELDLLTVGYAFNAEDTERLMREASPDIFIFHCRHHRRAARPATPAALSLEQTAPRSQRALRVARRIKPDVILLAHGAAIVEPDDAQFVLDHTDCHGVQLGSSIERLAIEGRSRSARLRSRALQFPCRGGVTTSSP